MIQALKRIFYTTLFFGVIGSFFLRCSSPRKVVDGSLESSAETSSSTIEPAVPENATGTVVPKESSNEFVLRTESILKELPTNETIHANRSREDHHETPSSIVASGKLMGEVMDQMRSNPENVSTGLSFYAKCAADKEIVLQVKALCLRNLRDWEKYLGSTKKLKVKYPRDVERLASQLPKTRFD